MVRDRLTGGGWRILKTCPDMLLPVLYSLPNVPPLTQRVGDISGPGGWTIMKKLLSRAQPGGRSRHGKGNYERCSIKIDLAFQCGASAGQGRPGLRLAALNEVYK